MHPSQTDLIKYASGTMTDDAVMQQMADHLEICEFCREFCENQRLFQESVADAAQTEMPAALSQLADRLFSDATSGSVIALRPLETSGSDFPSLLAADGYEQTSPRVRSLATLYSESPEILLRILRDIGEGLDYLQLIADDPSLASHVMVQFSELGKEYITDHEGRAVLDKGIIEKIGQTNCQVKMPEAVFKLEPLQYDPDAVKYSKEIMLETDQHDKIAIQFEGKTEGYQISVRIIELQGRVDFDKVTVSICQDGAPEAHTLEPDQSATFGTVRPDSTINIRLFQ